MATAAPGGFIPLSPAERADAAGFGPAPSRGRRRTQRSVESQAAAGKQRSPAQIAAAARLASATPEQRKAWGRKAAATRAAKKAAGGEAAAPPIVVAAPAAPRRRGGRRKVAVAGALQLRAELRKHKRGSKAHTALRKEIRKQRKARGYKGKAPLRRKPLRAHRRAAAPAARKPGVVERARRFLGGKAPRAPRPRKRTKKTAMVIAPAAAPVVRARKSRAPSKPQAGHALGTAKKAGGFITKRYDKHRQVVRAVTVTAAALGAVKLNQRFPDGVNLKVVRLEASAVGAIGAVGGALVAKKLGYGRIGSTLADVAVGGVIGTVVDSVAKGKPLIGKPGG